MRRSILFSLSLVLASVAFVVRADSASLSVKGAKQGDIKGSNAIKGREGTMECVEVGLEVATPRDAASGLASGKRQYKPLRCVKRVDRASPLLFTALVTNEVLPSVGLQVWGTGKEGQSVATYSIALKSANIASLRQFFDAKGVLMEEVTFSFATITLTWLDGGITAEDSLRAAQ